jgi:predicted nucleic acid-binding protein
MRFTTVTSPFTVDTNILIYANDYSNPAKQAIADRVVGALVSHKSVLPLQCLSEFYRSTTKKRLLTSLQAQQFVEDTLMLVVPVLATQDDLLEAMSLHQRHGLQFFDAMLLAISARVGCTIFFSEDMQSGQIYGTITVINPFKLSSADLDTLLA